MAREIKVKVGRVAEQAERRALDRIKASVLLPLPPRPEVEGQAPVYEVIQCGPCGAIGYAWVDDDRPTTVYCAYCRQYIQA
ncbi:MAG TPA: hypothetical protein VJL84_02855 [Kiloniellales bacterium]|nr:hypothetical protein [Kiloniellales bacterium]